MIRRNRDTVGWFGAKLFHSVAHTLSAPVRLIAHAAKLALPVLPFIKTALSMVPGIGSGVAAAIGAAEALAKGRPITDALLAAAQDAMPGGPAARMAFSAAVHMAKGGRLDHAVLDAAKAQLPAVAAKAFDAGLALAHGQSLQKVAVQTVMSAAPEQLRALKRRIPLGVPVPKPLQGGYRIGLGVLASKTLTPVQAIAVRQRLTPKAREGYDMAMRREVASRGSAASAPAARPLGVVRVWSV